MTTELEQAADGLHREQLLVARIVALEAEVRWARRQVLAWTDKKPTEPGVYVYRGTPQARLGDLIPVTEDAVRGLVETRYVDSGLRSPNGCGPILYREVGPPAAGHWLGPLLEIPK